MDLRDELVPLQCNFLGDAVHWCLHPCLSLLSNCERFPCYQFRRHRFVISRSLDEIGYQTQRIFGPLPAWTDNLHSLQRMVCTPLANLRVVAEGRSTRNAAAPTGPAEDRFFSCLDVLCATRNIRGSNVADCYISRGGVVRC